MIDASVARRSSWLLVTLASLALGCPGDDSTQTSASGTGTTSTGSSTTPVTFTSTDGGSETGVASMGSGGSGETGVDDSTGSEPMCGNGIVEGDEACDGMGESARCNDDCTPAVCGDGVVNTTAGETCDDMGRTDLCNANCTSASCGDSVVNMAAGEECDDGGFSAGCDDDCTLSLCGDGTVNPNAGEVCDDMGASAACDDDCTPAQCGDGVINMAAGEDCDDMMQTELCELNCTAPACGDGIINMLIGEECDGMGESAACDADCTVSECGDGVLNVTAGEICDDGMITVTCDVDCTEPVCGDGVLNVPAGEECDDGNMVDDDGCTSCTWDAGGGVCQGGADTLSISPNGLMVVCDDPTDTTCEEDFETLCPPGWGLCTRLQHINRNTGWNFATGAMVGSPDVVVGEIFCRGGGGAGHYTLGPYDGVTTLEDDPPLNCGYGSSRAICPSGFGCNEQEAKALCCAPTPSCGNGVIDSVEEECDDANLDETDDCLNSCSIRQPLGC